MFSNVDKLYHKILSTTLDGCFSEGRNGYTRTELALKASFNKTPIVSLRKTAWKLALREMEWFLSGSTNINDLHKSVRHWWSPWADKKGYIPYSYGLQFRNKAGFDQIDQLIHGIKFNPSSRRNVISTWDSEEMLQAPIANCHGTVIQAFVKDGKLNLIMFQRSADLMLGVPHNWVQYWALGLYLAAQTETTLNRFTWVGGLCHIYEEHLGAAKKMLNYPLDKMYSNAHLVYSGGIKDDFKADDFILYGTYEPIFTDKLKLVV